MEDELKNTLSALTDISKYSVLFSPVWPEFQSYETVRKTVAHRIEQGDFSRGNPNTTKIAVDHILKHSVKALNNIKSYQETKQKRFKTKFQLNLKKLQHFCIFLDDALSLAEDELAFLGDDHERKVNLKNVTSEIHVDEAKMAEELKGFKTMFSTLKAAFLNIGKYKSSPSRALKIGWDLIYYGVINKAQGKIEAKKFDGFLNLDAIVALTRNGESKLFNKILPGTFPKIVFNKLIYVPLVAPNVLQNSKFERDFSLNGWNDESKTNNLNFTTVRDPNNYRVQVRVLSSFPIPGLSEGRPSVNPQIDKILIHIHGGGFISNSSFSHQGITRHWANEINIPIFSIDYRLAPEYPYPTPIDDVWQAYYWIIKYCSKYIGIDATKIIVTGDSAGGALTSSLVIKIIQSGFRLPDGVLLSYPLSSINFHNFSHALMYSYKDLILGYRALLSFEEAYIQKEGKSTDPLISPLYAEHKVLEKFPKTKIILPLNDPLSYDTHRFAERLLNAGVDLEILEFPEGIHGVVQFGDNGGVPSFIPAREKSIEFLKTLFA